MGEYRAVKLKDKNYAFGYVHDDGSYRLLGYCGEYRPKEIRGLFTEIKHREFKHKFHKDGHKTKDQANNCYLIYILDISCNERWKLIGRQQCELCSKITRTGIRINSVHIFAICEDCKTKSNIRKLVRKSGCLWE